jgi:hypothetical protein
LLFALGMLISFLKQSSFNSSIILFPRVARHTGDGSNTVCEPRRSGLEPNAGQACKAPNAEQPL